MLEQRDLSTGRRRVAAYSTLSPRSLEGLITDPAEPVPSCQGATGH